MKATLAACADRAVGFGAAVLGLALLFLAARHLFAPSAMEPSSAAVASVPIAAYAASIAPRRVALARRPSAVVAAPHAATNIERRRLPRAILRASRPLRAARNRTFGRAVVHSTRGTSRSSATSAKPGAVAPHASAVRSHVASHVSAVRSRIVLAPPPPRQAHRAVARVGGATPRARPAKPSSSARVASTRAMSRRRTRSPFNRTIRFDTRPALVIVTAASATSLPAAETLPTIVAHRHR